MAASLGRQSRRFVAFAIAGTRARHFSAEAIFRSLTGRKRPNRYAVSRLHKHKLLASMSGDQVTKKTKVRIGTHNGCFHCDEVLACHLLRKIYPGAEVVRTRDSAILATCEIVVDVDGEYSHDKQRYDHHQRTFKETMRTLGGGPWDIKLSSAGLIYLHYGREALATDLGTDGALLNAAYPYVYENFVQAVDGIDNGEPVAEGKPRYRIRTDLSARVANLNRPWNAKEWDETAAFENALRLVGTEFDECVQYVANVWWPARSLVQAALDGRKDIHPSGAVAELSRACPWKEHLFELERELGLAPTLLYVVFPDDGGTWRVQGVPDAPGSFKGRFFLPDKWRGLRDEMLSAEVGVEGCIFVHATGFIGGNKTREGALQMALKALEMAPKSTGINEK